MSRMVGASNFCPAMAVPMTVKMPEPMTAPMPSAVSDHGPRDFFRRVLGLFRVQDQLIDRLAGNKLPEQDSSPHSAGGGGLRIAESAGQGDFLIQDASEAVYRVRVSSWNCATFVGSEGKTKRKPLIGELGRTGSEPGALCVPARNPIVVAELAYRLETPRAIFFTFFFF